jgi:hypothetical protein
MMAAPPFRTDYDTSFFWRSNQRYAHMPTACGLTVLAVQALCGDVLSD